MGKELTKNLNKLKRAIHEDKEPVSEAVTDYLEKHGHISPKVKCVLLGIDPKRVEPEATATDSTDAEAKPE